MFGRFIKPKRVYLDYAAATPLAPEVEKAMAPYVSKVFANASAIHKEGQQAKAAIASARLALARTLGVRQNEVIFTGSGTESNNLAIYGLLRCLTESSDKTFNGLEVITTVLEHPSVSEVLEHLKGYGLTVRTVAVDETGKIDLHHLVNLLSEKTALVTFAYANSEIGVVQPVKQITRVVRKYNTAHDTDIKVHLDAAQAPLWLSCQVPALGVDMLSLDAGKCLGPKGVGMLVVRHSTKIQSILLGGGQEFGLRAGTENTAGIVGGAKAVCLAQERYEEVAKRVQQQSKALAATLQEALPDALINGPDVGSPDRIANNVNISIPGLDTEYAAVVLDAAGIAVSTKSACSGANAERSAVVYAISQDAKRAASTLRFSLGPDTNLKQVDSSRICQTLTSLSKRMERFDSNNK